MKRISACMLVSILVLTACERGVKPSGAGALKPPAAIAKRESIDQTPELETHPRALAISAVPFDSESLMIHSGQPLDLLITGGYPRLEPTSPTAPAVPDGFLVTTNHWCPVMQKMKLNASTAVEHTVEFEGQIVGFCCDDCRDAWAAMDDAERRGRLKTVMEKK